MTHVITIGVDLAKNVYQVHGVDAEGGVVFRRQLRRAQMLPFFKKQPLCLVAWKLVPPHITGQGRSKPWGTKYV